MSITVTHDTLPQAVTILLNKVEALETALNKKNNGSEDQWFDLDELCNYLPSKPGHQTVYGWVSSRKIPFNKRGKKLSFLKSDIDNWLKESRHSTASEIKQKHS